MEGQSEKMIFTCDVCSCEIVPGRDARIHCAPCGNYDLCWSCHSSGRTSGIHETWHDQLIIRPVPLAFRTHALEPPNARAYHPYPSPDPYWGYMITPQKTASDLFRRLASAIYTYIDHTVEPRQTTWLEPEKCSAVIDMLGYTPEENTFRTIYHTGQQNGKDVAWSDEEVAFTYRQYGWDHRMVTRAFQQQHKSHPIHEGMPLLTHEGFLAMMLNDALVDPDSFCARLNGLLAQIPMLVDPRTSELFLRRDIPRACWPAVPDEEAVERCYMVQQERQQRLETEMVKNIGFVEEIGYPQHPMDHEFVEERVLCADGHWYYQHELREAEMRKAEMTENMSPVQEIKYPGGQEFIEGKALCTDSDGHWYFQHEFNGSLRGFDY